MQLENVSPCPSSYKAWREDWRGQQSLIKKEKRDKLPGFWEHLKRKKHQLDWSSIKILAKENNQWKRRSKEAYFITKHKDKAPLLNKKNKCPTISNIWKPILQFYGNF